MLVLSRQDVEKLLTMPDTIAAVEDGYRQLASGNVTMPQRVATNVLPHNGIHLSMPAFVGAGEKATDDEPGTLAIKIVTVFSDNPIKYGEPTIQGVVLLHDARTGKPLALMDAEQLTAMRTGAASGVATKAAGETGRCRGDHSGIWRAGRYAAVRQSARCARFNARGFSRSDLTRTWPLPSV